MVEESRVLWGAGTPRTMRVHWILHELELPYASQPILPRSEGMEDPRFRALSPRGKVPLYEEGELVIGESGAIATYLAERHGDRLPLLPAAGTPERALHDQWCHFALMELDATALYVLRRHEGLPEVYGEAPAANTAAREYAARQLGVVEHAFADERPHLCGESFCVADILMVSCLDWSRLIGIELPETLTAYRDRVAERPGYFRGQTANFPPEVLRALSAMKNEARA